MVTPTPSILVSAYVCCDGGYLLNVHRLLTCSGIAKVDLEIPKCAQRLRKKFAEFPPIFKNTTIERKDVGRYVSDCVYC